jgi:hypothetical protein
MVIRNYRANRTSPRYYRDLKAIDNPTPTAALDETEK